MQGQKTKMTDTFIVNPPFNFSIETMKRINEYMQMSNKALHNKDTLGHIAAIDVLYIETLPFWNAEQTTKAEILLQNIQDHPVLTQEDFLIYPGELLPAIKELHIFIFKTLHKNGISYSSKDMHKGLGAQEKKYNLGGED